jgi:hypothetical protein
LVNADGVAVVDRGAFGAAEDVEQQVQVRR